MHQELRGFLMSNFSYIIGHRGNKNDRLQNLICVLNMVKPLGGEVIVVEQDKEPFSEQYIKPLGVKYIFAKNSRMYNRSWGFNVGYRNSTENILYFADNDLVMSTESLKQDIESFENKETSSPYIGVHDCSPQETKLVYSGQPLPTIKRNFRGGCNYAGGILTFKRDSFEKTGGWGEGFEGWGGEDDHMLMKLNKAGIAQHTSKNVCYHLFHGRDTSSRAFHSNYTNNLIQINTLRDTSEEQCQLNFAQELKGIGNVNKYNGT